MGAPLRWIAALAAVPVASPLLAQSTLNLYCASPNTAWCQGMAVGFEKAGGMHVAVIQKAQVPRLTDIKVIRYDFTRYGRADMRRHLLERWDREVNALPR